MVDGPYFVLTVLGVLGTGLTAGAFCAFSTFVMRGLAALPPAQGIAAMNAINTAAVRPAFMAGFLGTAALTAVIAVMTFVLWPDGAAVELLLGSALYLCGSFGVTAVANVPRNTALLRLEPDAAEAAGRWRSYVREWTARERVPPHRASARSADAGGGPYRGRRSARAPRARANRPAHGRPRGQGRGSWPTPRVSSARPARSGPEGRSANGSGTGTRCTSPVRCSRSSARRRTAAWTAGSPSATRPVRSGT